MSENPLRRLPKMDLLLARPALAGEGFPRAVLVRAARETLEEARRELLSGGLSGPPEADELADRARARAARLSAPHLRRVVNATGVVLHTNLGRAPLGVEAARAAYDAALGYSNLEYGLEAGERGSRHDHVEAILCELTGAEAAMAVNNNAAAVLVMLSALAGGKRAAVSRGELVEIGGGFRVPDILARSGAALLEVGTTNKTRIADYEHAVLTRGAEVLLKVHTSNYEIVGFTQDTPLEELSALGRLYGLPLLYDLGSGALDRKFLPGLGECPTVAGALRAGADVVCFSGDKLLGGPQAGIAVGKRTYIEAMKRDPMARVGRIDKLSLAALEATLRLYRDPAQAGARIPALAMLNAPAEALKARAEALAARLRRILDGSCTVAAIPMEDEVGGGAMPNRALPGWAAALTPLGGGVEELEAAFRAAPTPVVGRIHRGALLLALRTLSAEDEEAVVDAAKELAGKAE